MSRPQGDAAAKLLRTARALAREEGCGALSVREVCRRARVNLGLFHYHFKSKECFVARVMEETYAEFFSRLTLSVGGPGPASKRLRAALRSIARFSRENRRVFTCLLRDGLNGDKHVAAFVARNFPRHIPIVLGLVHEGQKSGEFRELPDPLVMSFLMGSVSSPNLVVSLLELHAEKPFGLPFAQVEEMILSDAAIDLRVDMVLAGLSARRGR